MKSIALKLPDELLEESARLAAKFRTSRAEYIRLAIRRMNRKAGARLRWERLAEESGRARGESMRVNAEFAAFERDPDDNLEWMRIRIAAGAGLARDSEWLMDQLRAIDNRRLIRGPLL